MRRRYKKTRFTEGDFEGLISFLAIVFFPITLLYFFVKYLYSAAKYLLFESRKKYVAFINEHSVAVKQLDEINSRYEMHDVPNMDMTNSYDNISYYNMVQPIDYLTYELIYQKDKVLQAIIQTEENNTKYSLYKQEVDKISIFDIYDTEETLKNKIKLAKIEKSVFEEKTQKPRINYSIKVTIRLTNIQGKFLDYKSFVFSKEQIIAVINRLEEKEGEFYTDKRVWDSVCAVERARVTNKMRFAVYKRDGYRCRKCGSSNDLEVDHIYPIAKGGKTTFDNLQTLCHRCNALKADTVEQGATKYSEYNIAAKRVCPICGAILVCKKGKNGKFLACPNYPKCKHTERI